MTAPSWKLDVDTINLGLPVAPAGPAVNVSRERASPFAALSAVIRASLDASPCFVAFSGGCDSSLVLSAAVAACREAGHDPPIPVTYRCRTAPQSNETDQQELVVRWLGLEDWVIVDLDEDADLLSPSVTELLLEHGLMWPAPAYVFASAFRGLGAGLLLTGEGGDEVLGLRRWSYAAESLRYLVRGKRRPPREVAVEAARALAPKSSRARTIRQRLEDTYALDWLVPSYRHELLTKLADGEASEPLSSKRWYEYHLARPRVWITTNNLTALHHRFGQRWRAPLLDRRFLGALANTVKWHEFRGRTFVLRHHFSDWLPPEIIERRTKAFFNGAYFGPSTRAFAREWDATGLADVVDAGWLKEHWSTAEVVHAGTCVLLHQAWLATATPLG